MERLKEILNELKLKSKNNNLNDSELVSVFSIYPFNKFEYIICSLLAEKIIDFDDYLKIRNAYISRNKFLHLFEITSPRGFGEMWAQTHLNELVQEFERPCKKTDENYHGEYDFFLPLQAGDGIKVEVKASRAVDSKSDEQLTIKALATDSRKTFNMNFQQLKPECTDVFIWIGVWRDKIKYWVLSADDVKNNKYYSKNQHSKGLKEIEEGQLWINEKNIHEFDQFLTSPADIKIVTVLKANKKI